MPVPGINPAFYQSARPASAAVAKYKDSVVPGGDGRQFERYVDRELRNQSYSEVASGGGGRWIYYETEEHDADQHDTNQHNNYDDVPAPRPPTPLELDLFQYINDTPPEAPVEGAEAETHAEGAELHIEGAGTRSPAHDFDHSAQDCDVSKKDIHGSNNVHGQPLVHARSAAPGNASIVAQTSYPPSSSLPSSALPVARAANHDGGTVHASSRAMSTSSTAITTSSTTIPTCIDAMSKYRARTAHLESIMASRPPSAFSDSGPYTTATRQSSDSRTSTNGSSRSSTSRSFSSSTRNASSSARAALSATSQSSSSSTASSSSSAASSSRTQLGHNKSYPHYTPPPIVPTDALPSSTYSTSAPGPLAGEECKTGEKRKAGPEDPTVACLWRHDAQHNGASHAQHTRCRCRFDVTQAELDLKTDICAHLLRSGADVVHMAYCRWHLCSQTGEGHYLVDHVFDHVMGKPGMLYGGGGQ
ncbi:hypothetical protein BD626DRAFT_576153 [Schizophyllum amplum]|uniref:Uncharacterized protein n=1 Tax=Schizophyllum amplum TaxID=97359 RepID=A0A550BU57_9AGAR|nr:hypothetical protein BD626DRAFT_576153 [Auriculariopsis ampla]